MRIRTVGINGLDGLLDGRGLPVPQIELTGEPVADLRCHCHDCQRIAGGGYLPYSIYPHAAVEDWQVFDSLLGKQITLKELE